MAETISNTIVEQETIVKNGDENSNTTEELKSKLKEANGNTEVLNGNGKAHENGNGTTALGETGVINGNGVAHECVPAEDECCNEEGDDEDDVVEDDDEECDHDEVEEEEEEEEDEDTSAQGEKRGVDDECSTSKDVAESGSSGESGEPAQKQLHTE